MSTPTYSAVDEKTVYSLHYYEGDRDYFKCNLSAKAFKGNLWRALLLWDNYLEKNSSRHIPFLRNEYEIVEDTFSIEHLNVNMEEMKEKYVDIRQLKECDESMFLFVCCLVDALFENDTLWMAKASLE